MSVMAGLLFASQPPGREIVQRESTEFLTGEELPALPTAVALGLIVRELPWRAPVSARLPESSHGRSDFPCEHSATRRGASTCPGGGSEERCPYRVRGRHRPRGGNRDHWKARTGDRAGARADGYRHPR